MLLEITDLTKTFNLPGGEVMTAVDRVSLQPRPGPDARPGGRER